MELKISLDPGDNASSSVSTMDETNQLTASSLFNLLLAMNFEMAVDSRPLSTTQQVYRYVIIGIGIIVNTIVVVVVVYSRQLHYPRHVFWVAISLCNQLYMVQALLEIAAIVGKSRIACQIFVISAGAHYTIILSYLVLGALDRYLAITRYEWYKKKVNNWVVILLLLFTFISTFLVISSPFWTGYKSVKTCTVNFTRMHIVLVYDFLLGILSVVLQIMIFIRSRAILNQHFLNHQTPISRRFYLNQCQLSYVFSERQVDSLQADPTENQASLQDNQTERHHGLKSGQHGYTWFQSRSKLSRLETRAAFKMSVNVLPVCLCTFPITLNNIALYWCIRLQINVPMIFSINPYLCDLFLVHSVYSPVMYMCSSTEFRRALLHITERLTRKL